MDYKVTYHDNPQAYRDISSDWKFALRRNESGTWIFPPLAGVSYLIQQFILDRAEVSQQLYGDTTTLAVIDCTLSEKIHSKASAEEELFAAVIEQLNLEVPDTVTDLNKLAAWLNNQPSRLALLVYGLDAALRTGNMEVLTTLNRLATNCRFLSVILMICTDVTDPQFWPTYSKFAALIQNIMVVPRKSKAEGESFFRSLEQEWGVSLSDEQKRWVEDNLDHSLRFIKEVFRQVQKNPALTYNELYSLPSLEYKVQALLDNLLEDQREVVLRVVFGTPLTPECDHALKYLTSIRWISDDHGKPKLAIPFVDYYIRNHDRKNVADRTVELTPKEEAAFALLQSRRNEVVKRDELADAIWGEDAAERYSDWAIDQIIHRLKSKIGTENSQTAVRVVRGRGFILEEKAK